MTDAKRPAATVTRAEGDPIPTWGYHATHGARLFELAPGRRLPIGWADHPYAGQHPHEAPVTPISTPVSAAASSSQAEDGAPAPRKGLPKAKPERRRAAGRARPSR